MELILSAQILSSDLEFLDYRRPEVSTTEERYISVSQDTCIWIHRINNGSPSNN
jgi:hypothetical protein